MIAALTHASSDKADECTFYIFKVRCFSEKRDNSQRAKLYKIVTKRLIKSEKKLQLKYISKGHFQTVTFRGIIPVLHLLILFDQVLCNTTLHKAGIHPRLTQSQHSPRVLINLTVTSTPGSINQTTTLYINVITTVYTALFAGIHGFSLLSLCDNYLYE